MDKDDKDDEDEVPLGQADEEVLLPFGFEVKGAGQNDASVPSRSFVEDAFDFISRSFSHPVVDQDLGLVGIGLEVHVHDAALVDFLGSAAVNFPDLNTKQNKGFHDLRYELHYFELKFKLQQKSSFAGFCAKCCSLIEGCFVNMMCGS